MCKNIVVCGCVPWLYQYWPGGFMVLWFYVQELPKAQPAVVLVLKRLRRLGNSLKSHPTDWEKPGIEPVTPGLQDIGFPYTRQLLKKTFCGFSMGSNQYWAWRVYSCVYFMTGTSEGSTKSGFLDVQR